MKIQLKKVIIISIAIFIITLAFIALNSFRFWLGLAQFSTSNASNFYYYCIERVYKIASTRYITEDLTALLESNVKSNRELTDLIRILGVIGNRYSLSPLMKIYVEYQNDSNRRTALFDVIRSLGLIDGSEPHNKLLEKILEHKNGTILAGLAAGALYYHTGNRYEFVSHEGKKHKFYPHDISLAARQVIVQSKGRKRTYKEMLVLDSTFRPPEDSKGIEKYLR